MDKMYFEEKAVQLRKEIEAWAGRLNQMVGRLQCLEEILAEFANLQQNKDGESAEH